MEHSAPRIGSSNLHSTQATAPDNDVVNEVPLLDMECIQEVLCMSRSWKKVLVMAQPNSKQRESSRRPMLFMLPSP